METSLINIDTIVKKRMLKRLWSVIQLDIKNKEDSYTKQGLNSVRAREEFGQCTDYYFSVLKDIFSEIFRNRQILKQELKFENAIRALGA